MGVAMGERTPDDVRLGELMRASQAGDGDAYRTLLQQLAPRARAVVTRRRGAAADVEDLVQDVLLSVHVARATYDPTRPFIPWLLAIVRHRLADGARRFARREAHEVQVEDLDVTFGAPGTNSEMGGSDDTEALRAAVRALPRSRR